MNDQNVILVNLLNALFAANRTNEENPGLYETIEQTLSTACTHFHLDSEKLIEFTIREFDENPERAVPAFQKRKLEEIRAWMKRNVNLYIDDCGEVDLTSLTEGWDFEQGMGEETYSELHPAWDIASEVAQWYEDNRITE